MVTQAPTPHSPERIAPMNVAQPHGFGSVLKMLGYTTGLLVSSGTSCFLIATGLDTGTALFAFLTNVSAFLLCASKLNNMRTIFAAVENEITAPRALPASAPKPKPLLASDKKEPEREAPRRVKVIYPALPPAQKKALPARPNAYRPALARDQKGGSLDCTV